jgi:ubiquitin carboxyl-terminal hydrolase 5/13
VKLGTITSDGKASVHCYACDDEVIDNFLRDHLQNFGIDVEQQVKTEKTIAELTLDANLALTLSRVLEEGKVLKPLFGPGFTGIDNIGNSCYMNSVV